MSTQVIAQSIESLVEYCDRIIEEPGFAAAVAWKNAAPKRAAIGCFPVYTPTEIFYASGVLPVGLAGGGNRMEIAHADSRFQSFICSIVKSTLEQGMTELLEPLDGLVFHSICDPARNLASVYARNFPGTPVEYIHFPQNFEADESPRYLRDEYARVAKFAGELSGREMTTEDLRAAIALYNRVRETIRRLYALRRDAPHRLRTRELYPLVRVGHLIPPEEHAELLADALHAAATREGRERDRIRVVLTGSFCEQPPLDLIAAIEDAGCYLVDDDFLLGRRWFTENVPENAEDPLLALADGYINASLPTPVKHDMRVSPSQLLVERARSHRADAVIVLCAKFCEPSLFAYPLYRKALQEAGIPHLFLEFEEKMWMFDRVKSEIETFVESLLFD